MNTYEGVCRYCGQVQTVIADGQEEADAMATKECRCAGSKLERRKKVLQETATEMADPYGEKISEEVFRLSVLALQGVIKGAGLKLEGINFKISTNSDGQVKIAKKETNQTEMRC